MAAWKGPSGASTRRAWDERIAGQWERPRVLTWHHPRASSLKMLGLSLWEGRLPGQKTIENEDKGSHCSYRPESNFGTTDTVLVSGSTVAWSRCPLIRGDMVIFEIARNT